VNVTVDLYTGPREALRTLFELAEDSAPELAGYLESGQVLVARADDAIVGHLQLVPTDDPSVAELKNMAVLEEWHGRGLGRQLIQAAVELLARERVTRLLVATAAADVGNLRFYQRTGFRMRSVERDAFTPEVGYPDGLEIDGIALRDRVWFDRSIPAFGQDDA
jgi:GNAT superfamily N-acetyltransferase